MSRANIDSKFNDQSVAYYYYTQPIYVSRGGSEYTVIQISLEKEDAINREQEIELDIEANNNVNPSSPFAWASRNEMHSIRSPVIYQRDQLEVFGQNHSIAAASNPGYARAQKADEEFLKYLKKNPPENFSIANQLHDSSISTINNQSENSLVERKVDCLKEKIWGGKEEFEDTIKKTIAHNREMKGFRKRLGILKNIHDPIKYCALEAMDYVDKVKYHAQAADQGVHDLTTLFKSIAESPGDISKIIANLKGNLKGIPEGLPARLTYFTSQIAASLLLFRSIQMAGKTALDIAGEFRLSEAALQGSKRIIEVFQKAGSATNAPGPLGGAAVQGYSQVDKLLQLIQMKVAFGSLFPKSGKPSNGEKTLPEAREPGKTPDIKNGSLYSGSIEEIIDQADLSPEEQQVLEMASFSKDIAISASEAAGLGVPETVVINDLNEAIKLSLEKNKPQKALEYYFNKLEIRKYNVINGVDPIRGEKLAEKAWPHQNHHIGTNKHSKHTEKINEICQKYKIDIKKDPINIIRIPHVGPHCDLYHDWILLNLENIDYMAQGDRTIFKDLFKEKIREVIRKDPLIIHRDGWPQK